MSDPARPLLGNLNPASPDRLLTAKQLANLLATSVRTIWRLDSAGKLPRSIRVGGSVRWLSSEIHRWMRAGCPDRKSWENSEVYRKEFGNGANQQR